MDNWRNRKIVKDLDGKPVKVLSRWKYAIYLISFVILLFSLVILLVVSVSAIEGNPILSLNNGTLTINIYHHFDITPEFKNYINQTIGDLK